MYRLLSTAVLAVSFSMAVPGVAFAQEISTRQVYEAAQAGRMAEAQQMMDKVLRDHPNSAKAHYVQAELMAKQGRYSEAKTELETARKLAPGLPFATPQSVQELTSIIGGTRVAQRPGPQYAPQAPVAPARAAPPSPAGGVSWGFVIVLVLVGGAIFLFIRAVRSRRAAQMSGGMPGGRGGYPANYTQGGVPQPPYGPGPVQGGPMATGSGSGIGSGILGGLATGAAVGVGAVAAQQLMHRFTDKDQPANNATPLEQDSNFAPYNDMGGQNFGITDSSSWDDGGGSGGDNQTGGDW